MRNHAAVYSARRASARSSGPRWTGPERQRQELPHIPSIQLPYGPHDDGGYRRVTYTTGQAHWELLLRARAVENQCYVIAPAQGGRHENGRRTWGHSMIVDPWGEVLAMLPEGEGVVTAELDPTRIAEVRAQLPALAHRCL